MKIRIRFKRIFYFLTIRRIFTLTVEISNVETEESIVREEQTDEETE